MAVSAAAPPKRDRVLEELVASERVYVNHLGACVSAVVNESAKRASSLGLDGTTIGQLFGNITAIHQYHTGLLAQLEPVVSAKDTVGSAGVASAIAHIFKKEFVDTDSPISQLYKKVSPRTAYRVPRTVPRIRSIPLIG